MLDIAISILFVALLMATYFCIFDIMSPLAFGRSRLIAMGIVLAFIYGCVICFVGLCYYYSAYDIWVIWGAIIIVALIGMVYMVASTVSNWYFLNKSAIAVMLIYLAIVVYLTLISRLGNDYSWTNITRFVPFVDLQQAVTTRSIAPIVHAIKNLLLFVPFGFMLPLIDREKMNRVGYAAFFGMSVSTFIETFQHLYSLGMFDVDDIIANTLGAVVGYLVCRVGMKLIVSPNNKNEE